MDWTKFLISGIGTATATFLMYVVKTGIGQQVKSDDAGVIILRLHKIYLYMGWLMMVGVLLFVGAAIYHQDPELNIISALVSLLLGGLGVPCLLSYHNHRLSFDDLGFTSVNWRKKSVSIAWKEIEKVKFNPFTYCIIIKAMNKRASVNSYFVGIRQFVRRLHSKSRIKSSDFKLPI